MKIGKLIQAVCLASALAWGFNAAYAIDDDKTQFEQNDDHKWDADHFPPVTAVPEPSTIIAGSLLLLPFAASALRSRFRRK